MFTCNAPCGIAIDSKKHSVCLWSEQPSHLTLYWRWTLCEVLQQTRPRTKTQLEHPIGIGVGKGGVVYVTFLGNGVQVFWCLIELDWLTDFFLFWWSICLEQTPLTCSHKHLFTCTYMYTLECIHASTVGTGYTLYRQCSKWGLVLLQWGHVMFT